jgi:hypothetical protein
MGAEALVAHRDIEVIVQGGGGESVIEPLEVEGDGSGALTQAAVGLPVEDEVFSF